MDRVEMLENLRDRCYSSVPLTLCPNIVLKEVHGMAQKAKLGVHEQKD